MFPFQWDERSADVKIELKVMVRKSQAQMDSEG
jgi:hypothetical protein